MKIPDIDCSVEASGPVNLSEDPDKVGKAVSNILSHCTVSMENFSVTARSQDLRSFERIYETIHAKQFQKAYLRSLERNKASGSTWFYLNKQAAFAGRIALCEDAEESPLGPIKVVLASPTIDRIIDWATSG